MSGRRDGRPGSRNESGATAIIVAILAGMLFSLAGLAVDLGNAWARGRSVQKQADVSAIGSGHLLPMDSGKTGHTKADIAAEVATRLNQNPTLGQQPATATMLTNGDHADGEISFETFGGGSCINQCPRMTVLPPQAQVDFGFAAVMGFSNAQVQRPATVEVQSELPPKQDMLPFWLPSGCGYGPAEADTTQGGNGGPHAPSGWLAPASTQQLSAVVRAAAPTPTPVGTHALSGPSVTNLGYGQTASVSGFSLTGTLDRKYDNVTLRAYSPDGTKYIDFAASAIAGLGSFPSFLVGPGDITNTAGDWYVFALAAQNKVNVQYSSTYVVFRVTGGPTATPSSTPTPTPTGTATPTPTPTPTGVPIGCVGQDRGNFGQMDSPRTGYTSQGGFSYNLALGIDHTLRPYIFPSNVSETKDCGANSSLLPGAKLDDTAGPGGNGTNCIKGDTGNDGPKMYAGMVEGPDSTTPGRLDYRNGTTTCAGRSNITFDGETLNNDTLECFLRNGATRETITQPSGVNTTMLDPLIIKSPRFVYLPVVYAKDREQKNFQPILQFVPGFITEETLDAGPVDGSGHVNGLQTNGNSVKVLHVFTFNRDALPPSESSDTVEYDPDVGGAIVRLVG